MFQEPEWEDDLQEENIKVNPAQIKKNKKLIQKAINYFNIKGGIEQVAMKNYDSNKNNDKLKYMAKNNQKSHNGFTDNSNIKNCKGRTLVTHNCKGKKANINTNQADRIIKETLKMDSNDVKTKNRSISVNKEKQVSELYNVKEKSANNLYSSKIDEKCIDKDKQITKIENSLDKNKLIKCSKRSHESNIPSTTTKEDDMFSNLELHNLDWDKADEILLNVKKKKLNDIYRKEYQEDLLFSEEHQSDEPHKKNGILENIVKFDKDSTAHEREHFVRSDIKSNDEIDLNKDKVHVSNQVETKQMKIKSMSQNTKISKSNAIINKHARNTNKVKETNNKLETANYTNNIVNNIEPKNDKKDVEDLHSETNKDLQNTRRSINIKGNRLREKMLQRLIAARSRYLNKKPDKSSGTECRPFQSNSSTFQDKVKMRPVDIIVKNITNMPKSHIVIDMGCGEGTLSRSIHNTVLSYNLASVKNNQYASASADVVVYRGRCTGKDFTQYIVEADRLLKQGGCLLIAELEDHFDDVILFAQEIKRLGFALINLEKTHKLCFLEFLKATPPHTKNGKLPVVASKPYLNKKR